MSGSTGCLMFFRFYLNSDKIVLLFVNLANSAHFSIVSCCCFGCSLGQCEVTLWRADVYCLRAPGDWGQANRKVVAC